MSEVYEVTRERKYESKGEFVRGHKAYSLLWTFHLLRALVQTGSRP